ncbi:TPA: hypothetical protein ACH3X2_011449 [Trebouxia sp. C0005]
MTEAASVAAQFFSPWDPPPPFCSPPSDSKSADVVQKLAQFAAKNGASFVELIKVKQKDNPEYQFLFGGEGSDYYRWILFCSCHNLPFDQSLPAAQPANQQTAQPAYGEAQAAPVQDVEAMLQQALATCSPEVRDGFSQVLAALSGSKESIKQSQQWFMACMPYASGMAAALALHVRNMPDYDKQLHVLYLANDILLKRLSQRPPGSAADVDEVAQAFKPWLPGILGMAFSTGGRTDQVKERLLKILTFWSDRKLYDKDTMQQLEAALLSGDPNAMLQAPAPKQTARSAKRKWDQPAPAAPAASNTAPIVSQFMQAAQQLSSLSHAAYQQQPPVSQPVYHDPQMQQSGFSQAYQQHPGSLGMQSVHSTPNSSFRMPNFNVPPGSMGMHSMPAGTPWQSDSAQQQQPWGMPGQAPGYAPYPQLSMPMNQQMPGIVPGQQYMPPPQMQHQQHIMPQLHTPQHTGGGAWYPPPGPAAQGLPPGVQGQHQAGLFQNVPVQPVTDMHAPPPDLAAAAPSVPAKPQTDPMSFPPGLIPQLVAEKLKTDPPYSPLSPLDIDQAGLPSTSEPDSYLQSRIDRFYAELQDWRPGVQRTDGGKPRRALKEELDEDKPRKPFDPRAEVPVMPSDGSFQGSGGGGLGFGNAGLGFHGAAEEQPANAFDSYREQRSGRYKSSLIKPPPTSFS